MFCPKCGRKLADDEKFCHNCGMLVNSTTQPQTYGEDAAFYMQPMNQKPKKSAKKVIIPIVAVAIAVVAGVAALLVYLSSTKVEREMKKALDTKSYAIVSDAYYEFAEDGKGDKAAKVIVDYIEDAIDILNNEFTFSIETLNGVDEWEIGNKILSELISFCINQYGDLFYSNETVNNNEGIEKISLSKPGEYYTEEVIKDFKRILYSKIIYYQGLYEYSRVNLEGNPWDLDDEWLQSIYSFACVLENDKNYSDAQGKIIETLNYSVNNLQNYYDANYFYDEYNYVLFHQYTNDGPDTFKWLSEVIDEELPDYISDVYQDDYCYTLTEMVESGRFASNGDYIWSEIISKSFEEIRRTCAEQYVAQAEEAYNNGDIDAAVGNMECAAAIYPNGGYYEILDKYEAKISEYE